MITTDNLFMNLTTYFIYILLIDVVEIVFGINVDLKYLLTSSR